MSHTAAAPTSHHDGADTVKTEEYVHYAALVQNAPDAMVSFDLNGLIVTWNGSAERLFGLTAAQAVGTDGLRFVPSENHEEARKRFERVLRGETVQQRTMMQHPADGAQLEILLTIGPVRHGNRIIGGCALAQDVTERENAARELKETNSRLQLAMQAGKLGVWQYDFLTKTLQGSPVQRVIFDAPPEGSLDYEELQSRVYPEDLARIRDAMRNAIQNRTEFHIQHRILWHDGSLHWVEVLGHGLYDADGNPLALLGTAREITTERELVQQQIYLLAEAEQERTRLHAVVEQMPAAIFLAEAPDGRLLLANQEAERIFGIPNTLDLPLSEWRRWKIYQDDGSPLPLADYPLIRALRHGETTRDREMFMEWDNGTCGVIRVNAGPIRDAQGQIVAAIVSFSDVTESRRMREDLARNNALLNSLVEGTREPVVVKDRALRYLLCNPVAARAIGHPAEYIIGKTDRELFAPEIAEPICTNDLEVMETGTSADYEEQIPGEGGLRTFLCTKDPLRDTQGNVTGVIIVGRDVTQSKRDQEEIQNLNLRMQRMMQETHHRVKNNLQVISALTEIQVAEHGDMVPESALRRIGLHARTLAALHDLLTWQIKKENEGELVSARKLFQTLARMLQFTTGERPFHLTTEEATLTLDQAASASLLISELVSNAVKHGAGGVTVTIRCLPPVPDADDTQVSPRLQIEVSDDGPGFPAGFDALTAANTGLELIDSLARWDLRGDITYGNRADGGAIVTVSFSVSA